MANLTGGLNVELRVRDVAASAAYSALLNVNPVRDFHGADGRLVHIVLAHKSGSHIGAHRTAECRRRLQRVPRRLRPPRVPGRDG